MNRREFVQGVGAAFAAAPFALRGDRTAPPARLQRIGLELYSIRDAMKADPKARSRK